MAALQASAAAAAAAAAATAEERRLRDALSAKELVARANERAKRAAVRVQGLARMSKARRDVGAMRRAKREHGAAVTIQVEHSL